MRDTTMRLTVISTRLLAPGIRRIELAREDGEPLPTFTAGAHINVTTPGGRTRSYSLTDPSDGGPYAIAVARQANGRGASRELVDDTTVGDTFAVSVPRNTFPLQPAPAHLLVAGGIGITPLLPMLRDLVARSASQVRLLYLTRDEAHTAFLDELMDPVLRPHVTVHHSAVHGRLDLWPYLADPEGTSVYCCGPRALTEDVRALTMHWNPRDCHFESFAGASGIDLAGVSFTVFWQPAQATVPVSSGQSALDALREHGIPVESSCEAGTCGTCVLQLLSGEADHRDAVLTEEERAGMFAPCVSRAASEDPLVLAPRVPHGRR